MTTYIARDGGMISQLSQTNEATEKWALVWFKELAKFHKVSEPSHWRFDKDDVIAFLIDQKKSGVPTWKRLKIVENLIHYRNMHSRSSVPGLEFIRSKLRELNESEKRKAEDIPDEVAIGILNPNEPTVIQTFRKKMRLKGMAMSTEKSYVNWAKRFMRARNLKTEEDFAGLGTEDIEAFLTDLVIDEDLSPSSQDQAFYSLLLLFRSVFKKELGDIDAMRSKKPKLVPTVMSRGEVSRVLGELNGMYRTIGQLLYGCGLRLSECLRLRIMDIDFDQMQIRIFNSKGKKSRLVPLPASTVSELKELIDKRLRLHQKDLERGTASVWLPYAVSRKYPKARQEFKWQYLFASHRISKDPKSGELHRHHIHADTFPAHLKKAVIDAKVNKHVTSHVFRHSFATHLIISGTDIRTVQELLGHNDVKTTMIYTHVLVRDDIKVTSPLDSLNQGSEKENEEDISSSFRQGSQIQASEIQASEIQASEIQASEIRTSKTELSDAEAIGVEDDLGCNVATEFQVEGSRSLGDLDSLEGPVSFLGTGMSLKLKGVRPSLLKRLARFTCNVFGIKADQRLGERRIEPDVELIERNQISEGSCSTKCSLTVR